LKLAYESLNSLKLAYESTTTQQWNLHYKKAQASNSSYQYVAVMV